MCLAIPMKVKQIDGSKAIVESHGVEKEVDITITPDLKVKDKVLIHAGFVIEKLDEETAREIEETWDEYYKSLSREEINKEIDEC